MGRHLVSRFVAYVRRDRRHILFFLLGASVIPVAVLALFGWLGSEDDFGYFWTFIEPVTGVATLIGVFLGWVVGVLNSIDSETEVVILIRCEATGESLELPYHPVRSQLSRAELQGILSLYYGERRYPSGSLRNALEPQGSSASRLNEVIRGARDMLEVDVNQEFFQHVRTLLQSERQ